MTAILVTSGLFNGGLVLVAAAVVPTFRALPPGAYVQVHQLLDKYIERYMPALAGLTMLAALALMWRQPGARAALGAGVLLTASVSVISHFGNRPLNKIVQSWRPEDPPSGIAELQRRWSRLHLVRTAAGVLALIVFASLAAYPAGRW